MSCTIIEKKSGKEIPVFKNCGISTVRELQALHKRAVLKLSGTKCPLIIEGRYLVKPGNYFTLSPFITVASIKDFERMGHVLKGGEEFILAELAPRKPVGDVIVPRDVITEDTEDIEDEDLTEDIDAGSVTSKEDLDEDSITSKEEVGDGPVQTIEVPAPAEEADSKIEKNVNEEDAAKAKKEAMVAKMLATREANKAKKAAAPKSKTKTSVKKPTNKKGKSK